MNAIAVRPNRRLAWFAIGGDGLTKRKEPFSSSRASTQAIRAASKMGTRRNRHKMLTIRSTSSCSSAPAGLNSAVKLSCGLTNSSASSPDNRLMRAVRPCVTAFPLLRFLPSSESGPRLSSPFRRFAAICRSVAMNIPLSQYSALSPARQSKLRRRRKLSGFRA